MAGVLLDLNKSELKFVATDGFRLAKIIKMIFSRRVRRKRRL